MDDAIQIEDRWYVLATSSRADDRTAVLKHDDTFAVFDRLGDIHRIGAGEQGLYHTGTRFLSQFEVMINGLRPMLLYSSVREDNGLFTTDLTTPDCYDGDRLVVHKGTVHLFRAKVLWDGGCHEHLRVGNFGVEPVEITLELRYACDFADIFEVRGFHRARRGTPIPTRLTDAETVVGYEGLDRVRRYTTIACRPNPTSLTADRILYRLQIAPHSETNIHISTTCGVEGPRPRRLSYLEALHAAEGSLEAHRRRTCSIVTSNEQFNDWINRSLADVGMLTTETAFGPYPYAGVPWYSTPFGRDGLITALQTLWIDPALARGVLAYLAAFQADRVDSASDAEPGKILHETRSGELAALGEIPFGRYYGSIDSTPLFVVLAGAYFERTGDYEFVRGLWPNIERALAWIDRYGDRDGDGFVEYARRTDAGLINQGWKDSEDAVFHQDGRLADGPIALCEVQGYVYRAKQHAANLAQLFGESARAVSLRSEAELLARRFESAFWSEEIGSYVLALDGEKRPCRVRTSNAGQVLWSGLPDADRAARVTRTLFDQASFSGWGIRTVAADAARFNPMSYHNGSIWPHDNSLIAMGLAHYGHKIEAVMVLEALFEATRFLDLHRLPELFCGFVRRAGEGPTLYPVACSPQAWASASPFYLLEACLGLSFNASERRLRFAHPILPRSITRLEIRHLTLGAATIDLAFERHDRDVGVNVLRKTGELDVSVHF